MTASGRFVRLGTASIVAQGGVFVDIERLDLRRYAQRPALAKVLCDYILYHDHNVNKALELCAEATKVSEFRHSILCRLFFSLLLKVVMPACAHHPP